MKVKGIILRDDETVKEIQYHYTEAFNRINRHEIEKNQRDRMVHLKSVFTDILKEVIYEQEQLREFPIYKKKAVMRYLSDFLELQLQYLRWSTDGNPHAMPRKEDSLLIIPKIKMNREVKNKEEVIAFERTVEMFIQQVQEKSDFNFRKPTLLDEPTRPIKVDEALVFETHNRGVLVFEGRVKDYSFLINYGMTHEIAGGKNNRIRNHTFGVELSTLQIYKKVDGEDIFVYGVKADGHKSRWNVPYMKNENDLSSLFFQAYNDDGTVDPSGLYAMNQPVGSSEWLNQDTAKDFFINRVNWTDFIVILEAIEGVFGDFLEAISSYKDDFDKHFERFLTEEIKKRHAKLKPIDYSVGKIIYTKEQVKAFQEELNNSLKYLNELFEKEQDIVIRELSSTLKRVRIKGKENILYELIERKFFLEIVETKGKKAIVLVKSAVSSIDEEGAYYYEMILKVNNLLMNAEANRKKNK